MAHCEAEGRKHPTMDLYVGIFNSKLYSSNRSNGSNGHYNNWHRFNVPPAQSGSFRQEPYADRQSFQSRSFRGDGVNGFHVDDSPKEREASQRVSEISLASDQEVQRIMSLSARSTNVEKPVALGEYDYKCDMPVMALPLKKNSGEQNMGVPNGNSRLIVGSESTPLVKSSASSQNLDRVLSTRPLESNRVSNGDGLDVHLRGPNGLISGVSEQAGVPVRKSNGHTSNELSGNGETLPVRRSFGQSGGGTENGDLVPSRRSYGSSEGASEDSDMVPARSSTSSSGKLTMWDDAFDGMPASMTSKKNSGTLTAQSQNAGALINSGGIREDVLSSNRNVKAGELNMCSASGGERLDAFSSGRYVKPGEMTTPGANGAVISRKSGEQDGTSNSGLLLKNSPNRGTTKGSPGHESLFLGSLKTTFNGSLDSSSSTGGSSNGGSPTAAEAAKDNGKMSPFGNILSSKGGPIVGSFRSHGNGKFSAKANINECIPPRSSHSSFRKSGEILVNRKSSEMLASSNGYSQSGYMAKGGIGVLSSVSSNGLSSAGNVSKGSWNGSAANNGNVSLNTGNLLVGTANGNVMSCGAGIKANSKSAEGNMSNMVDISLMKRALSSLEPEEIKNAGNEYYKRGHFSEALVLYDKAIAICPDRAPYRSNRAAALCGLGRVAESVQECEEAIRLDSSYARAHQRVASLYLRLGLTEAAKKHFQAAGQQTDLVDVQRLQNIERHVAKCLEARKSTDWSNVIRESDAAIVAGADSAPQIFGYKSEALLRLQKPEEADNVCTAAQKVESSLIKLNVIPADSSLLIIRAQVEMALGRFDGAIAAAESAARIDPSNAEVALLLRKARAVGQSRAAGNEMFKAGKYYEALALYGEGLESDPTNAVLLCNRAACRSKLGQWEKAVEDCDAALSIQPNYLKALMRRANCWAKLERLDDALRDYEILRREMPGDMEVARGFFDVQVAIKKSRGEEIYKMKFGGDVEEVSNNEQFREAVSSPGLSVVQFNTRWSDRCRQISPFIDELCKRYPCANFVKVDVDDNPYLAKIECVTFVPTFKMYRNGQKVKEIMGPSLQSLEYAVKHYSL